MIKPPEIVDDIVRAVSEKLGREAISRKVNSREEYFILDLAFSYFQKADRNRRNDYRSGYLYYEISGKNYLLFVLAHSPIMTSFFKVNFDYEVFRNIVIDTEQYRDENYLRFKRNSKKEEIKTKNIQEFLDKLDEIEKYGFVKSVFAKDTKGKTGIGNIFGLSLAKEFSQNEMIEIMKRVALNNPCNQTPKGQHKTSRHSRNVIAKQQGCQKKNGPPEESGRPLTIACHLKN